MTILNVFLSMGIPAIDAALESVVHGIHSKTPGDVVTLTSLARVIGLLAALCVASYECWVMMLGRRSLDIFKILRIVGLSFCISGSSAICAAISLPGKELAKVSQHMASRKNGEIKVGKGMPNIEPTWKTAQITIDNLTLAETMKKLSNVYGVNITIQSKKNYNQCITAHFNRGETLEGVLRIINNIFPDFRYKIDGDNIIVY